MDRITGKKRLHKFRRIAWICGIVLLLTAIKIVWVAVACRNQGSVESEKAEILARRAYLVNRVITTPRQLMLEMPRGIGLQFMGEWALYSCSMLAQSLTNIAQLYPETRADAAVHIDSLIKIAMSTELRLYDAMDGTRILWNRSTETKAIYHI